VRLGSTIVAAVLVAAVSPAGAASRPDGTQRVVLVPFENVTRAAGARENLMAAVALGLERKGFEVVTGDEVEVFLRKNRIRYLDALPASKAEELRAQLRAHVVMTGSILSYDRKATDPLVALSLTAIGAHGALAWSDVEGLAASESRGAFDLQKTADVAVVGRRLVERMIDRIPPGRFEQSPAGGFSLRRAPRVYRSKALAGKKLTLCVLPLENLSGGRDAGRVVEAAIHDRLSRDARVRALPPADLRQAVLSAGLRAPSRLTLDNLRKLTASARTSYYLQGSIFQYRAAVGDGPGAAPATVEIYLRLIDADDGRTVWSGLHGRLGTDYETVLQFGAVRDPATLAAHVVTELMDAFTRN
jgi:TolB-like protein